MFAPEPDPNHLSAKTRTVTTEHVWKQATTGTRKNDDVFLATPSTLFVRLAERRFEVPTTIRQIQDDILNPDVKLSDILRKAKVLSYRLDVPEFK
jgi:hypothetical protein